MKKFVLILLIIITTMFGCSSNSSNISKAETENTSHVSSKLPAEPGNFANNAVYLAKSYVSGSTMQGLNLDTMLDHMRVDWAVNEIYVNVGSINCLGQLVNPPTTYSSSFLSQLSAYEAYHGYNFKVYAWFNGRTDATGPVYSPCTIGSITSPQMLIRPDQAGWRTAFSATTDNFVQYSKPHTTSTRKYDGVLLDFEPSGQVGSCSENIGPKRHNCFLYAINNLRQHLNNVTCPSCSIAVAAQKWAPNNNDVAWWTSAQWYATATAPYADTLVDMPYRNNSYAPYTNYRSYMQNQVKQVLLAVSGISVNGLAPPSNRRVLITFPGFGPNSSSHPVDENVKYASLGTLDGLNDYVAETGEFSPYFAGACMYQLQSGFRAGFRETVNCGGYGCTYSYYGNYDDPNNYFATIAQDWRRWKTYWLGNFN